MLIDIGTNGEMVLAAGDHFLVSSVAAGPAFEGGNNPAVCPVCRELSAVQFYLVKIIW